MYCEEGGAPGDLCAMEAGLAVCETGFRRTGKGGQLVTTGGCQAWTAVRSRNQLWLMLSSVYTCVVCSVEKPVMV